MRTEHIGDATLYLGDCLEILPTLGKVDAVVTDPPYCSGGFSETGKKSAQGMGLRSETIRELGWFVNDRMTTGGIAWLMRQVALWSFRILRDGGSMIAFTDWRQLSNLSPAIESAGYRFQNLVVWMKPSAGLGSGFRAQHELAMQFTKGTGVYYNASCGNVIACGRITASEREHQTEKPVELIHKLAEVVSDGGQTILDPFMGSGTTGVACANLGRKFIGIEIEPKYFDIACKRIETAYLQPRLFDEPRVKAVPQELGL